MNNNDVHFENVLACTYISKHHQLLVTMSTTTSHSVKFYEVWIGNNCNFKILTSFYCYHSNSGHVCKTDSNTFLPIQCQLF